MNKKRSVAAHVDGLKPNFNLTVEHVSNNHRYFLLVYVALRGGVVKSGVIRERMCEWCVAIVRIGDLDRGLGAVHCHNTVVARVFFSSKQRSDTNEHAEPWRFLCQTEFHEMFDRGSW